MTDDSSDLERAYNPRVTVPDFQQHLDRAAESSAHARSNLPSIRDLRYGAGPRQCLDIYPASRSAAPAVVYVHGGYWRALSKEAVAGLAGALQPRGISTVIAGYDLAPAATLDEIVGEIGSLLAWCAHRLEGYGVDPRRVHLAGTSAGAHLLATSLMRADTGVASAFQSATLVSGIYDLAPVLSISVNADLRLDAASALRNSPLHFCVPLPLDLLIAVGGDESAPWIEQSTAFARTCRNTGNAVEFMRVRGAHHFSTGLAVAHSPVNERLVRRVLHDA